MGTRKTITSTSGEMHSCPDRRIYYQGWHFGPWKVFDITTEDLDVVEKCIKDAWAFGHRGRDGRRLVAWYHESLHAKRDGLPAPPMPPIREPIKLLQ